MRLMDQVAQATAPVWIDDASGVAALRGAASLADEVRAAPLKYVLDEAASRRCWDFICANEWLLDPADPLLRIPARRFWLEWFAQNKEQTGACPPRVGFLVEAEAGGRSGWVQTFWEAPGQPVMCQARIVFDLDHPPASAPGDRSRFYLRSAAPGMVAQLVNHLAVEMAPEWIEAFSSAGPLDYRAAALRISQSIWADLAVVLGFQRVLLMRLSGVAEATIDRKALNAARAPRGRPPLLDHVEVTLNLFSGPREPDAGRGGGHRSNSRLHLVRGHFVHRAGKLFWRRAHQRGDAASELLPKIIRVRG